MGLIYERVKVGEMETLYPEFMEGVSPIPTITSWIARRQGPKTVSALGAGGQLPTSYGKRFVLSGLPECTGQKEGEGREGRATCGVWALVSLGEGNNRLSGKERGKIDSIRFDLAITGLDAKTYRLDWKQGEVIQGSMPWISTGPPINLLQDLISSPAYHARRSRRSLAAQHAPVLDPHRRSWIHWSLPTIKSQAMPKEAQQRMTCRQSDI
ncbi:hypothetical protein BKA59DRAFT_453049 [Fusarium tricinctum]|uniref:Uncharacterized protein n=1 Tax=Fusarium tricinctum TaxID=61284 RepID=A0A8K0RZM8_9HYPO|nr:hypothetical protein BKA59DRAFT_453049 [Fusarium tricinctum]